VIPKSATISFYKIRIFRIQNYLRFSYCQVVTTTMSNENDNSSTRVALAEKSSL